MEKIHENMHVFVLSCYIYIHALLKVFFLILKHFSAVAQLSASRSWEAMPACALFEVEVA